MRSRNVTATRQQGRRRNSSSRHSLSSRPGSASGSTHSSSLLTSPVVVDGGEIARKRRKLQDDFRRKVNENPMNLNFAQLLMFAPILSDNPEAVDAQLQNSQCDPENRHATLLEPPDAATWLVPNEEEGNDEDRLQSMQFQLNLMALVGRRRYQDQMHLLTGLGRDIKALQATVSSHTAPATSLPQHTLYDCTGMFNALIRHNASRASLTSFGINFCLSKSQKHAAQMKNAVTLVVAPGCVTFMAALEEKSGDECQAMQASRKPKFNVCHFAFCNNNSTSYLHFFVFFPIRT